MKFETALFLLPGLIIGLTVHEAAHAISAKWLGDRTSEKMGRISLNPLRHLSLYGTLALFFLGFGWGKPVIVNLYNFKKPKFYYLLSSLAGPASNLLICAICLGVLYMNPPQMVYTALLPVFMINGMLAAINLVPIPPLDGSKIWPCLIPGMKPTVSGKWSMVWVAVLIVAMYTGGIGKVLSPIQDGMFWLLPERGPYYAERPENFPEELVPPENAADVMYIDKNSDGKGLHFDCHGMTFTVKDIESGQSTYLAMGKRFSDYEWQKLKYVLDDPNTVASEDLTAQQVEGSDAIYQMQTDYWVKPSVGMIQMSRLHTADKNDETHSLSILYMDDLPEIMIYRLEDYKKLHPEEFEGNKFDVQPVENLKM